jgi:integrase
MPKYKWGSGIVYYKRGWCYLKYYVDGKPVYEATGTKDRAEARRMLQVRLGQRAEGRYVGPAVERVTFDELARDFLTDYEVNGRKSLRMVRGKVSNHLIPFFGDRKAHQITTADVQTFIAQRQEEGASNGEINRELAALKRMYNLGLRAEKIAKKPYIPKLEEDNARQGFFERWEFEAVLIRLPEYLRPLLTFAYYTGWRVHSEILPLTWDRVDLEAGTVRLYRGTTKNKDGRLIHLPQVLSDIIEHQWQEHLERYPDCSFVFHRNGERIKYFRRRWVRACQEASLTGKIPHDFRRTAVRNLVRAGVPERVAMQICGHKTRSVFDRYNIVSATDLKEAAKRIDLAIATSAVSPMQVNQGPIPASNGYPNGYPAVEPEFPSPRGSA